MNRIFEDRFVTWWVYEGRIGVDCGRSQGDSVATSEYCRVVMTVGSVSRRYLTVVKPKQPRRREIEFPLGRIVEPKNTKAAKAWMRYLQLTRQV
jgi:hypothetical protein